MVSDAKKRSNDKWNANNLKSVTAKIRKDKAEEFAKACAQNGESMHSAIKRFIDDFIEKNRMPE